MSQLPKKKSIKRTKIGKKGPRTTPVKKAQRRKGH